MSIDIDLQAPTRIKVTIIKSNARAKLTNGPKLSTTAALSRTRRRWSMSTRCPCWTYYYRLQRSPSNRAEASRWSEKSRPEQSTTAELCPKVDTDMSSLRVTQLVASRDIDDEYDSKHRSSPANISWNDWDDTVEQVAYQEQCLVCWSWHWHLRNVAKCRSSPGPCEVLALVWWFSNLMNTCKTSIERERRKATSISYMARRCSTRAAMPKARPKETRGIARFRMDLEWISASLSFPPSLSLTYLFANERKNAE